MKMLDIAERLYASSISSRAELNQSIQNPLIAVSVFAASASQLLPNLAPLLKSRYTSVLLPTFYASTTALIVSAGLAIGFALLALLMGRYVLVGANERADDLADAAETEESALRFADFSSALAESYLEATRVNEGSNKRRWTYRRYSFWMLLIATACFVVSVGAFLLAVINPVGS